MPRHYRSTPKDRVINFTLGFMYFLGKFTRWVDKRRKSVLTFTSEVARRMLRYFQTTPIRTITTDFLASAAVIGIMVFPVAMGILWIVLTF